MPTAPCSTFTPSRRGPSSCSPAREALALLWRDRQIDYSRIRSLAAPDGIRYKPFWDLTVDALRYAAERLELSTDEAAEAQLLKEYACLSAFPENLGALKRLRAAGLPLGILSNGNPQMLDISVKSAGMQGLFDHVLSVESVRLYKTAPAAYGLAPAAFGTAAQEILFVSSNGGMPAAPPVRLHHFLDQSCRPSAGAAGRITLRCRARHERPARIRPRRRRGGVERATPTIPSITGEH